MISNEPEIFNRHFSPVLIVPRSSSFDSRLWHHGHERAAILAEWLMRPKHSFRVLCEGFVVRAKNDDG